MGGVLDGALPRFFVGRNVLVTGGASFIGSHLVELLLGNGALVTVADDLSSGQLLNIEGVIGQVKFLEGDLRDATVAAEALKDQELVFHLAAMHGGRGYIDTHPVDCLNNVVLDHSVLAAAAKEGVGKVVFASSACVYPTTLQASAFDRGLLVESDAGFEIQGTAFADGEYGWAKLFGEFQLRAFSRQYGIDGIAGRIFTAYGERENESHTVIALIAKALARLDPYPIWGDGAQTRNFTYVGDTVMGMALAAASLSGFDVVNVGSPLHTSVNELVEAIFRIVGWRPTEIRYELDKPVGVLSHAADVSKSETLLGWSSNTPLDEGLRRTVEWYRSVATGDRLANLDGLLMER